MPKLNRPAKVTRIDTSGLESLPGIVITHSNGVRYALSEISSKSLHGRFKELTLVYDRPYRLPFSEFIPAICDFYDSVVKDGVVRESRLNSYFKRWEHKESPQFVRELRTTLKAYLSALAES